MHELDPARALEIAVAAAIMRTYGADSGTPLPAASLVAARRRRLAADAVPQAHADGHDPGGRGRLVRGGRAPWTWRWAGEEVDDRDVLWNLGNAALQLGDDEAQQHFYGYALSRAREAGAVTAVVYCLQRLCFGHFLAGDHVAVRSSAEEAIALAESIGQPAMTALPDRLADAARGHRRAGTTTTTCSPGSRSWSRQPTRSGS